MEAERKDGGRKRWWRHEGREEAGKEDGDRKGGWRQEGRMGQERIKRSMERCVATVPAQRAARKPLRVFPLYMLSGDMASDPASLISLEEHI